MILLLLKTIHIVAFVAWFAAMFYINRLFVYHKEALYKNDDATNVLTAQYSVMEWRVYKVVMTPAMIVTWLCGLWMLHINGMEWFKLNMWMHHKLLLLILLSAYHGMSKGMIKKIQANNINFSTIKFRMFNDTPIVMLLLITSLAVFKNQVNPLLLVFTVLCIGAIAEIFSYAYKSKN